MLVFMKLPTIAIILLLSGWLTLRGIEKPGQVSSRKRRSKLAVDLITFLQISSLLGAFMSLFRDQSISGAVLAAAVVFLVVLPLAFTTRFVIEDVLYAFSLRQTPPKQFDPSELAHLASGLDAPPDPNQPARPRKRFRLSPFCPNVPEVRLSEFSTIGAPLR